jgi:SAM-dependent methyltransferase
MITLTSCPGCSHDRLIPALPGSGRSDNSLGRLLGRPLPIDINGFDLAAHAKSAWSVCGNCGLMFAANRPDAQGLESWYPPLFQLSEERGYNTWPLPPNYIEGKRRAAAQLFERLNKTGIFEGAKTLIHFRTGPGHFLESVRRAYPHLDAYGLEYFEHPARHAKQLMGESRVAQISTPEPKHPFPVKRFDVIVANHFLTHAHEPKAFLAYLRSILSDTGTLVITNELDHALSFKSLTAYPRGLNFFHKQLFTRATLIPFLASCGFSSIDISEAPGKTPKYIMLLCRKAAEVPQAPQDSKPPLALIRGWRWKHRAYRTFRFAIDPARRLLR